MIKHILIVVALLYFNSNAFSRPSGQNRYPEAVQRLGLEKEYDQGRWFMYMTQGHIAIDRSDTKGEIYLASLPLALDSVLIRNDTVEINMYFILDGKKVDELMTDESPIWGVVFVRGKDKILKLSSRSDVRYYGYECPDPKDCPGFEGYLDLKENVDFVKANKDKIDPWFRKEAIRRGIIKNE